MKKKMSRIFMIMFIIFSFVSSQVYAVEQVIGGDVGVNAVDNAFASKILGAVQFIGYAIALGMLIMVGAKYTMSAADEKATIKSSSVKYIIGAILIAGAATIAKWIFNLL